jgi:hypothetical protein
MERPIARFGVLDVDDDAETNERERGKSVESVALGVASPELVRSQRRMQRS